MIPTRIWVTMAAVTGMYSKGKQCYDCWPLLFGHLSPLTWKIYSEYIIRSIYDSNVNVIRHIWTQFVINISYSLALTSVDSIVFCSQLLSLGLVFEFELFLWLLANANSFIWRLTAIALYACCKVEWVNMS